jgi:hypothetical protein
MAKTKISEFDTNPDLNTDINSINIAEGCAPSGINNAIRTLMSDLKEWQSGAQDIYIAPAGTAAAPSWTFNGDLDTGFYRVTANELGVAVGGSAVGKFTSSGFDGTVPTQSPGDDTTKTASTAFVQAAILAAKQALYPVGSIYINATNATNPGTLLGFGTWVAFGAGRVPVGFDSTNALFDSAEETGGSADAIVVTHDHSFSATTSSASLVGTLQASKPGVATGIVSITGTGLPSGADGSQSSVTEYTINATHTHTVSGTTGSAGSSGTNANYQPYITVYMWKRTA